MRHKKLLIIGIVLIVFLLLASVIGYIYLSKPRTSPYNGNYIRVVVQNPMADIVNQNTKNGQYDEKAVINQGIDHFNETYINFLLLALGTSSLHKSSFGYGNPVIEFAMDTEIWNTEIINGAFNTKKGALDKKDIRITLSREEAVKALLSPDITSFMKGSVSNGNTKIEMIAGKTELFSKGYLDMYNKLSK